MTYAGSFELSEGRYWGLLTFNKAFNGYSGRRVELVPLPCRDLFVGTEWSKLAQQLVVEAKLGCHSQFVDSDFCLMGAVVRRSKEDEPAVLQQDGAPSLAIAEKRDGSLDECRCQKTGILPAHTAASEAAGPQGMTNLSCHKSPVRIPDEDDWTFSLLRRALMVSRCILGPCTRLEAGQTIPWSRSASNRSSMFSAKSEQPAVVRLSVMRES